MARRLEIEVVGDTKDLERALGRASKSSSKFGTALKAGAVAAGAGLAGLAVIAKRGFGEFLEAEKITAQTNATLKATGGVANVTAKEVGKLAEQLMKKSGVDDEQIQAGENWLLTFKNVHNEMGRGNDIFDRATKASLDLAVAQANAKGGSVNMAAASNMLGKALNDPLKGLTALGKAGVTFSQAQKDQIAALVKSGKTMQAQKLILRELETQVGGSAAAMGKTLGGQLNILKERFNNWAGDMVSKVIPSLVRLSDWISGTALPTIQKFVRSLKDEALVTFEAIRVVIVQGVIPALRGFIAATKDAIHFVEEHKTLATDFAIAITLTTGALTAYEAGVHLVHAATKAWIGIQLGLNAVMAANPIAIVVLALAALTAGIIIAYRHSETFRKIVDGAFKAIRTVVDASIKPITAIVKTVFGGLVQLVQAPLNAIRGVIDIVMGLIRGDWGRAWEGLKTLAANTILLLPRAMLAIATQIGPKLLDLGEKLIGKVIEGLKKLGSLASDLAVKIRVEIVKLPGLLIDWLTSTGQGLGIALARGIIDGIKNPGGDGGGLSGMIKTAIIDGIGAAIPAVKAFSMIRSPSELTAREIGRPLAEGIAKGIRDGKISVSEAMVEVANAAVDRAKTAVEGRAGELGSWLQRAFDARQGSKLTKTELLISKKELEREKARLAEAITNAQADLNAAMAGTDPAAIAAAQRALDDAQYAQWLADAQRQATAERVALEQRQWIEQQNFQKRLGNLQTYLSSGHATAAGAKARILDLMHDFGIQAGNMAQLLGKQFAAGLRKMIPAVAAAAEALRIAVKNEGILLRGRSITIQMEEKAEKKKGSEVGATHIAGLDSISTKLHDEVTIGRGMGLSLSSGYRPGDDGDHGKYPSHAIDMSGSGSAMAQFATAMFGRAGTKDVIYGNLNVWQDNGSLVSGWGGNQGLRADHFDHVHASVFDKGGWLMPGATLAVNNTGAPERVVGPGGGGSEYHFHFPNYVGTRDELVRAVKSGVQDMERNGGSLSRPAPGF